MLTFRCLLIGAIAALTSAVDLAAADGPRPSPPLTILRDGAPSIQLSEYRGKIVALAFIQTTCSHCQQFTTILNILAKDYAPRGVQFLECAFNDDARATMPEFMKRFTPAFPVGYTTHEAVMSYLQHTVMDTKPVYVPRVVLLDRAGMIRQDITGDSGFFGNAEANMRVELNKMLKGAVQPKQTKQTKK